MDISLNEFELKDILSTRQWFYDFLGKSYYMEPDRDRFLEISNFKIFSQFVDKENLQGEDSNALIDFFNNVPNMSDEDYKKLKEEYHRLFIGPGHLPAPPWESVYLSKEKIIFDEHTLAVRDFYKKWGVNTKEFKKEPDDHIGFELEFVSILIGKSIDALNENNIIKLKAAMSAQKEFFEKHILLWVEEFADKLFNNTEEKFYKGLALFTIEYINMDFQLLKDILINIENLD